jgi:3-oxoacyl-[acyl-carrier-protein] synthase II
VLEEYEHAAKRGASIICEVLGCGMSGDAYDLVPPDPEGRGAVLSMRMALETAGLDIDDIGYVNAHGTATPVGDLAELRGIWDIAKSASRPTPVSSTKSYHGHLLGASAGLEAIVTAKAITEGVVPANLNLEHRDPALPDVALPTETYHAPMRAAISNSFGFGGHNSSLVLGKV